MDLNITKLSHYDCKPTGHNMVCGKRMRGNIQTGKHPFDGMDQFHLYAELDGNTGQGIILPQYMYLSEIYEAYPNATWVLNLRDPAKWLSSIDRWQDLRQRFIWGDYKPDLPSQGKSKPGERPTGEKDEDMINFYNKQAQRVRDFAKDHPSLHFVEVRIDQEDAGEVMEEAFGISKQCWGNKNVNKGDAFWREA
jgi:Sulfotransferase domain